MMTNGDVCAKGCAGRGLPPSATEVQGYHPLRIFEILCAKVVHLITNKVQLRPILLVINGSLKLCNEKLAAALCCAL